MTADLTGQTIHHYRVQRLLGEGGMANVYLAHHEHLGRIVALKVIRTDQFPPSLLDNVLRRFAVEARSLAALDHPHIVRVFDYGDHNNLPYLVMEYLPGGTLSQRLSGPMPFTQAAALLRPIASALEYAHAHGVLHRDVKPSNILFSSENRAVLTDFGIARLMESEPGTNLTSTGVGIGTPDYMAPEQGLGRPVDGRADVYALGVVFYELLTGKRPFIGHTPMEVILQHNTAPLPPPSLYAPDLPEYAIAGLTRALEKDPAGRYPDMTAFGAALQALAAADRNALVAILGQPQPSLTTVISSSPPPPPLNVTQTVVQEKSPAFRDSGPTRRATMPAAPQPRAAAYPDEQAPGALQKKSFAFSPLLLGILGILVIGMIGIGYAFFRPKPVASLTATLSALFPTETSLPPSPTVFPSATTAPTNPPPPSPTSLPAGALIYIVQQGDTFSGIAQAFNLSVQELLAFNPQIDPNTIVINPGDQILIPGPSNRQPTATWTVAPSPTHTPTITPTPTLLVSPTPNALAWIGWPENDATLSERTVQVTGWIRPLVSVERAFLIVQSQSFGRLIFPQAEITPSGDGTWQAEAAFQSIGYYYDVYVVITTTQEAGNQLADEDAGLYGLQSLPQGAFIASPIIAVIRR